VKEMPTRGRRNLFNIRSMEGLATAGMFFNQYGVRVSCTGLAMCCTSYTTTAGAQQRPCVFKGARIKRACYTALRR